MRLNTLLIMATLAAVLLAIRGVQAAPSVHPRKGQAAGPDRNPGGSDDGGFFSIIFLLAPEKAGDHDGWFYRFVHGPFFLVLSLIVGLVMIAGGIFSAQKSGGASA